MHIPNTDRVIHGNGVHFEVYRFMYIFCSRYGLVPYKRGEFVASFRTYDLILFLLLLISESLHLI